MTILISRGGAENAENTNKKVLAVLRVLRASA